MDRPRLTEAQWDTLLTFLSAQRPVHVGDPGVCRRFLDAVPWVLRSGAQWRLLPARGVAGVEQRVHALQSLAKTGRVG